MGPTYLLHHLASPFSLDMTGGPGWQWFPAGNVAKDEPSASMPLPLTSRHAAPHKQPLDDGAFRLCGWWLETLPAPSRVISEDPARLRQGSKIDHPVRCIKISSSKAPLLQLCRRSSPLRAALECLIRHCRWLKLGCLRPPPPRAPAQASHPMLSRARG